MLRSDDEDASCRRCRVLAMVPHLYDEAASWRRGRALATMQRLGDNAVSWRRCRVLTTMRRCRVLTTLAAMMAARTPARHHRHRQRQCRQRRLCRLRLRCPHRRRRRREAEGGDACTRRPTSGRPPPFGDTMDMRLSRLRRWVFERHYGWTVGRYGSTDRVGRPCG